MPNPKPKDLEDLGQREEGWEKEFERVFPCLINPETVYGKDTELYKTILFFIRTTLFNDRQSLIRRVEEADFYHWNENTQRMIKEKIIRILSEK